MSQEYFESARTQVIEAERKRILGLIDNFSDHIARNHGVPQIVFVEIGTLKERISSGESSEANKALESKAKRRAEARRIHVLFHKGLLTELKAQNSACEFCRSEAVQEQKKETSGS